MKTIDTLIQDIYSVVEQKGGWTEVVNEHFKERLGSTMSGRLKPLEEGEESRKGTLRMSNVGQPCSRKLWYHVHEDHEGEELRPETRLKFLFGDILEDLLLSLAEAAGHTVEGTQDVMKVNGLKGHRDAVIDGVTVDVKSASSYSFQKFKNNALRYEDPFGYIQQLSSYVYAGKDDPLVKDKTRGAFLVIDKQHGTLCLDVYDFTSELSNKEEFIEERKKEVNGDTPPERAFQDEPDGYTKDGVFRSNGNRKLGVNCSYCDYKKSCWPNLRTFVGKGKPKFLTEVVKEPRMMEVK